MPRLIPGRKAVGAGQDYLRIGPQCHRPDMHNEAYWSPAACLRGANPRDHLRASRACGRSAQGAAAKDTGGEQKPPGAGGWRERVAREGDARGCARGWRERVRERVRAGQCMKRPQKNQPRAGRIRVFSTPLADPLFDLSREVWLIIRLYSPVEVYRGGREVAQRVRERFALIRATSRHLCPPLAYPLPNLSATSVPHRRGFRVNGSAGYTRATSRPPPRMTSRATSPPLSTSF